MKYDVILFNGSPFTGTSARVRGNGVHRLATEIRKGGWSCFIVDYFENFTIDEIYEILDHTVGPNTIMVGMSEFWIYNATENTFDGPGIARKVKSINNKTKLCVGGPNTASRVTDPVYQDFDHFFHGYCETQILDFLGAPHEYPKIIKHDEFAQDGFDFKYSYTDYDDSSFITKNEVLGLELARGCRFKCKFCSYPLIGQKKVSDYIKDPDVVREELIRNYERFGTTRYCIMDDTFNDSMAKIELYHEVFTSLPFKIRFWCFLRADLLVLMPRQAKLLVEMGLDTCFFGFESFNHESAKSIGKGMDPQRIKDLLKELKQTHFKDVRITGTFIIGLPHETHTTIREHWYDYLKENQDIDSIFTIPLFISNKNHPNWENTFRSEFDLNYEHYGYSFKPKPNNPEDMYDGTFILNGSYKTANSIYQASDGNEFWSDSEIWVKEDGPDGINSMDEAWEIKVFYNDFVEKYNAENTHFNIYNASFEGEACDEYVDPKNRARYSTMRAKIAHTVFLREMGVKDYNELYNGQFEEYYKKPLMNYLKGEEDVAKKA